VTRGLIIAAPASGSGKTTLTLALLASLQRAGVRVAPLKIGPDYIDAGFLARASGRECANLDPWGMRPGTMAGVVARAGEGAELVVAEGVMGLFDGAADGSGSTAEVAERTGWPVVLVVDASGMGASAAAVVHGLLTFRPAVPIAGVIFNRAGSERHARLLAEACRPLPVRVLGALAREPDLGLPARHLGLVQACEHPALESFLERAASALDAALDAEAVAALARPCRLAATPARAPVPALGGRIAVARDHAFAFTYPHLLDGWREAGASLSFFSPLADEAPERLADAVYLPGGYPELYALRLAGARRFKRGLQAAAAAGATIYGECGGYMTLGRGLVDRQGARHEMVGLLPVETSFAAPRMTLGYRRATLAVDAALGSAGSLYAAHEFHFARLVSEGGTSPLFHCRDASGRDLGPAGAVRGRVVGSFVHLIDMIRDS